MLAVGEHLWGEVDDRILRMTSGLAGGVGCTGQELCGALSGGVLLIGALHGRTRPDEDDGYCQELTFFYQDRFAEEFGETRCDDLLASGYGSDGKWPCSLLIERATRILLEMLQESDEP